MISKDKLSRFCSFLSLLLSIAVIVYLFVGKKEFTTISLDSFVGINVALLAIIITFVVGWQIFNTIDFKRKVDKLEIIENKFQKQEETIEQLSHSTKHCIFLIWGEDALESQEYVEAFRYLISSLQYSMMASKPLNIDVIKNNLETVAENLKKGTKHKKDLYAEVAQRNDVIRSLSHYSYIKSWYEPLYDRYINNVKPS